MSCTSITLQCWEERLGAEARLSFLQAPPPKAVWLLGADDYDEADVPSDAFVIYQVPPSF